MWPAGTFPLPSRTKFCAGLEIKPDGVEPFVTNVAAVQLSAEPFHEPWASLGLMPTTESSIGAAGCFSSVSSRIEVSRLLWAAGSAKRTSTSDVPVWFAVLDVPAVRAAEAPALVAAKETASVRLAFDSVCDRTGATSAEVEYAGTSRVTVAYVPEAVVKLMKELPRMPELPATRPAVSPKDPADARLCTSVALAGTAHALMFSVMFMGTE
jgi:hypothetical protein